jgi:hypothetical protein
MEGGAMARALAVFIVFIAAFVVLIGVLALFAGIAPVFPTTEEAFFKLGVEIKDAPLAIVGVVVIAAGYVLTRFAGTLSTR